MAPTAKQPPAKPAPWPAKAAPSPAKGEPGKTPSAKSNAVARLLRQPMPSEEEEARAEAARRRGAEAFGRGDYAAAAAAFSAAIEANPGDPRAWTNRALAHIKLGLALLAWGDAAHVLHVLDPGNEKATMRSAWALQDMKLYADAIKVYNECPSMVALLTSRETNEEPKGVDRATVTDIMRRIEECTAAQQKAPPSCRAGSGASGNRIVGGEIRLLISCRAAAPGGPRHWTQINAALSPLFSRWPLARLQVVPGQGVGLVATQAIAAGTTVYAEEPRLAVALSDTRCYHCLLPLTPGRVFKCRRHRDRAEPTFGTCDRRYCSAACERDAWAFYHEPLCSKDVARVEDVAWQCVTTQSRDTLFAWKMLGAAVLHQRETGALRLCAPADTPPLCHLARRCDSDLTRQGGDLVLQPTPFVEPWLLLRRLLSTQLVDEPALSIRWYAEATSLLLVNVLGVGADGCDTPATRGLVLLTGGSMFNHSCDANVVCLSDMDTTGSAVTFRTTRAVQPGEQLCIAYVDPELPRADRRLVLRRQYGFQCRCRLCS